MNIKEMIRAKLGDPHYIIEDIEITSSVLDQMSKIVKYIMTNENLTFDEAFLKFYQSGRLRNGISFYCNYCGLI